MADRASASILIGGPLRRALLDDLCEAARQDGGFAGWDEAPLDGQAILDGAPLEICAYELRGGVFDALEAFCETHGLAYVRRSGSCAGAFGPERVVHVGDGAPETFETNEGDAVTIGLADVRRLGSLAAIEALFARATFVVPPLTLVDGAAA